MTLLQIVAISFPTACLLLCVLTIFWFLYSCKRRRNYNNEDLNAFRNYIDISLQFMTVFTVAFLVYLLMAILGRERMQMTALVLSEILLGLFYIIVFKGVCVKILDQHDLPHMYSDQTYMNPGAGGGSDSIGVGSRRSSGLGSGPSEDSRKGSSEGSGHDLGGGGRARDSGSSLGGRARGRSRGRSSVRSVRV